MTGRMTIAELRAMVVAIAEQHPLAEVDFVYPVRHGEKRRSRLAAITGYAILLGGTRHIARFEIDWAPSARFVEPDNESQP